MQNIIQNFRQSSIVFEKPACLQKMFTKKCAGFFLFYSDLELFAKIKKDLVSTHSFFALLLITQDLNKIKKIPHTLL